MGESVAVLLVALAVVGLIGHTSSLVGAFYSNLVVVGSNGDEVLAALAGTTALCSTGEAEPIAVFPDDGDGMIDSAAAALSARIDANILAATVHDDDLLICSVWRNGEVVAQAIVPDPAVVFDFDPSDVEGFDDAVGAPGVAPTVESVEAVVDAIGRGDRARAIEVLTDDYALATERHRDLLAALDLPTFPAGWGHRYLNGSDSDGYDGPTLIASN